MEAVGKHRPDCQLWTPHPASPPPQGPQQYQPFLPGSVQALSSRPASGAPSRSPAAGLEDRQVLRRGQRPPESRPHGWSPCRKWETWTQMQRSHVEMGAETAEMLLQAEDCSSPPAGRGRTPLGSGLGGHRGMHSGLGEAALSVDGPRLCQEGDSHTARGSISRTAVVGREGSKGAFQGPGGTSTWRGRGSHFPTVSARGLTRSLPKQQTDMPAVWTVPPLRRCSAWGGRPLTQQPVKQLSHFVKLLGVGGCWLLLWVK